MLKQLIATSLIQMGVANVTPICNEENIKPSKQAENIVTPYNFTCTPFDNVQIETNGQTINNNQSGLTPYNTGTIQDSKAKLYANNNYINVKGNIYRTYVYKKANEYLNTEDVTYWANNLYYQTNNEDIWTPYTSLLYVIQLTPYNYNENTEIDLKVYIEMQNMSFSQEYIQIQNIYMYKTCYITTQENWANYLDLTVTTNIVDYVHDEIEDPNNNYYYEKTSSKTNINDEVWNGEYEDTIQFTLVPKHTNYLILQYTPMVAATWVELGTPTTNVADRNVITSEGVWNYTGIEVSGTNIIPSGNYEVVDLPGLCWEILTMPFAFVSQAFNLTLFPGTPYQLNISNLFLSIIAIFVFVGLISFFLKFKG